MKNEELLRLLTMAETSNRTGFTLPEWWGPRVRQIIDESQRPANYTQAFEAWWRPHWGNLGAKRPEAADAFRAGWNAGRAAPETSKRPPINVSIYDGNRLIVDATDIQGLEMRITGIEPGSPAAVRSAAIEPKCRGCVESLPLNAQGWHTLDKHHSFKCITPKASEPFECPHFPSWCEGPDGHDPAYICVHCKQGADQKKNESCPGPQGQDRREVGGSEPATPQRKSLESSPGLHLPRDDVPHHKPTCPKAGTHVGFMRYRCECGAESESAP